MIHLLKNPKVIVPLATAAIFIIISITGYSSLTKMGNSGEDNWLVKIGNKEYGIEDYSEFYNDLKNNATLVSEEEIKNEAFDKLVEAALIEMEAQKIGLVISDKIIKREIQKIPSFLGEDKKFDKNKFRSIMKKNGIGEGQFIDKMRRFFLRKQLMQIFALNRGAIYPDIIKIMTSIVYDQRRIKFIEINAEDIKENIKISDDEIEKYFKDNQTKFMRAEMRTVEYILLDYSSIKNPTKNSDVQNEEAMSVYNQQEKFFQIPETRDIEQLICTDKETAELAYDKISHGEKFDDMRNKYETPKEYARSLKNISFGEKFDKKLLEIFFSMKQGEYSTPYQTALGWHIFYLNKINLPQKKSFAEVKDQIKAEIAEERNQEKLKDLADEISKKIKDGKDLITICKEHDLSPKKLDLEITNEEERKKSLNLENGILKNIKSLKKDNIPQILIDIAANTPVMSTSEMIPIYDTQTISEMVALNGGDTTMPTNSIAYLMVKTNEISPPQIVKPNAEKLKKIALNHKHDEALKKLTTTIHKLFQSQNMNNENSSFIDEDNSNMKEKKQKINGESNENNLAKSEKITATSSKNENKKMINLEDSASRSTVKNSNNKNDILSFYLQKLHTKPRIALISRSSPLPEFIPSELLLEIFELEPQKAGKIHYDSIRKKYYFCVLEEVKYPDQEENEQITSEFNANLIDFYFSTISEEYISYLYKKYNPKMNKSILKKYYNQ